MSDFENEQKRELERLRLASELRQLARLTTNPHLKARCLRAAESWSDETDPSTSAALPQTSSLVER